MWVTHGSHQHWRDEFPTNSRLFPYWKKHFPYWNASPKAWFLKKICSFNIKRCTLFCQVPNNRICTIIVFKIQPYLEHFHPILSIFPPCTFLFGSIWPRVIRKTLQNENISIIKGDTELWSWLMDHLSGHSNCLRTGNFGYL